MAGAPRLDSVVVTLGKMVKGMDVALMDMGPGRILNGQSLEGLAFCGAAISAVFMATAGGGGAALVGAISFVLPGV